ncbi:hypothetical protein NUW58_g5300 [Xylaria curta]|uniref:Uncharacterized protein n=1 Tax=Xylaria curta TaxID=42375 RepID=A0ACC1P3E0_9PEZI|nr:hypothetical protein NUW58_g5300 [Xylaria curta]
MAPKYQLYGGFTVKDALAKAGAPTNKFPFQDGEPPVDFFTHPPENSAAVFSTLFGRRPFRSVENPTDKRNGHYWWAAEIQRVCDELRRNLPDVCRKIETPRNYWDLYKYFDAYDIYYRGAQNLWNVINTFVFENEYAAEVVRKEQKIQTEQYMPLFESLASELLRKADIQTRLLTWDREKQWDVLKLLTPYELQIFEGYEKYPDHFLEAIRDIFVKHCDGLLKKPCSLDSSLAPVDRRIPNMSISERRAALRHYLQSPEALEDPFMDKFEIPNKIINGIVIADGTSQTAARKAKYKGTSLLISNRGQQGAQNVNSFPVESREGGVARRVFTTERCSSAPSIGGDPANIISGSATNQARVYPGDSHEVNKKLVGGQDLAALKGTSEGVPSTTNAFQVAMPTPNGHFPQIPTASNQVLPPVPHHDDPRPEGSHIRHSPTRQPKPAYAPYFVPGMVSPYQAPDAQGLDTSHGPFAHQIPPYAVPQQHMQDAPPPTWQPQHSHQAHTQRNSRGYIPNVNLPYYQTESGQQFDSSESSQRQRRMSSTQTHGSGRWQHTGSDGIHGPKVIYCKGDVQSQGSQSHRVGHWPGRNRNDSARRPSTASIGGNYQRPSNAHPQHYSTHAAPHQIDRGTTKMGNNLRASANLGNAPSAYACVNASKMCNVHVKFDPCLCNKCSDRDRTLFVSRLKEGINQDAGALEHLKQHFSKFGPVEKVTSVGPGGTAVYVRFAHAQYAVAAVHTEPFVQIGGIGEAPLKVDFRTGSQFHVPLFEYRGRGPNNRFFSADNAPQEPRLIMPQSPLKDSNTFNTHPNPSQYQSPIPEEQVRPPSSTAPEGQLPGANPNITGKCSIDPTDRTATQSGFGMETTRPLHAALDHQTFGSQSTNGPVSIDAVLHDTANTQPQDSRYDRILSCGSTQELARNIAGLDYDVMSPRRENHYNSLNDLMQPGLKEQQTAIGPNGVQDSLAILPENEDEETSIDYGTIRIRPGKARYVAIPPAWRQESTSIRSPPEPGFQTLRTASPNGQESSAKAASQTIQPTLSTAQGGPQAQNTECRAGEIATQTERQSDEEKVSSDDANRDTSTHTKRKASETEGGEKAPGQPSPKKKFAKLPQPGNSAQQVQSSKSGDQQHQGRVGDTGPSKASKKKKNKNKNRRNQTAEPAVPKEAPTAALYEAQTFKPAIAGYDLPPYPRQDVPWTKSGCGVLWYSNHDFNSHANRLNESEPFPAYRDLMSGPQLPFKGHKSHASGPSRSISSTASTIIQAGSNEP